MFTLHSLLIFAALAGSTTLRAADVIWDDLCGYAGSQALTIATTDGSKVAGTRSYQTSFSVTLYVKARSRTLLRADIASIRLENHHKTHYKSHCMADIASTAGDWMVGGLYSIESPYFFLAPVFLVGAPAILAGGTPFCAIYDLIEHFRRGEKITII